MARQGRKRQRDADDQCDGARGARILIAVMDAHHQKVGDYDDQKHQEYESQDPESTLPDATNARCHTGWIVPASVGDGDRH
jgi:hypothetical protein